MNKGLKIFIRISSIILCFMSILLMLATPIGGIIFLVIAILLFCLTLSKEIKPVKYSDNMYKFDVAGLHFYQENISKIHMDKDEYEEFGYGVQLIEDPDNPYDNNAIKVIVENQHIGYVPADKCLEVRRIIDSYPRHFFSVFETVNTIGEWESAYVVIYYQSELSV